MVMTFPLIVLGALSAVGGWFGIPRVLGHPLRIPNGIEEWLEGSVRAIPEAAQLHSASLEVSLMGISVALAGLSACIAFYFYLIRPELPGKVARSLGGLYNLVYNKYFVDEFYFARIINPIVEASRGLWASVDVGFIDRGTYLAGDIVRGAGGTVRTLQNGNIQQYALYIALGAAAILFLVMR
jgi:NADH-quinone oxidoreductase subunit L